MVPPDFEGSTIAVVGVGVGEAETVGVGDTSGVGLAVRLARLAAPIGTAL